MSTIKIGVLICICIVGLSCQNYYKAIAVQPSTTNAKLIDSLQHTKRYFIYRQGDEAFEMSQLQLINSDRDITFTPLPLPEIHRLHLKKGLDGRMRYVKRISGAAINNEVHFYSSGTEKVVEGKPLLVSINNLTKIEILKHDKGKSAASHIAGGIMIGVGVFAITAYIALSSITLL